MRSYKLVYVPFYNYQQLILPILALEKYYSCIYGNFNIRTEKINKIIGFYREVTLNE